MRKKKSNAGPRPFLKWAGGKRQLLDRIVPRIPDEFSTYHEPFIGGGAVFFAIAKQKNKLDAKISDSTEDLINSYAIIRDSADELIDSLSSIKQEFLASEDREKYYYETREKYNSTTNKFERTQYMLFLNKTCFNGLYRVNKSGKFNVPFCDYKNPAIFDEGNIRLVSELLNRINVQCATSDFEKALDQCKPGDFCYLDPPYHPETKTSFTSYTANSFNEENQVRLHESIEKLDANNIKTMLSNSDSKLIRQLYSEYNIEELEALRAINSDGKNRKGSIELLITNYYP